MQRVGALPQPSSHRLIRRHKASPAFTPSTSGVIRAMKASRFRAAGRRAGSRAAAAGGGGQLPVLKGAGRPRRAQRLAPPPPPRRAGRPGLNSAACGTMAANSKSCYNHINEINQRISSSQMSGWQGGIQPSSVINFWGAGEGNRLCYL